MGHQLCSCSWEGCSRPVPLNEFHHGGMPGCRFCKALYCAKHWVMHLIARECQKAIIKEWLQERFGVVANWVNTLVDQSPAIKLAAEALRPEHTVTIEVPTVNANNHFVDSKGVVIQGGLNIHFPMTWSDGTQWLARIKIKQPWNRHEPLSDDDLKDRVDNEFANLQVARRILGDLVYRSWLPVTSIPNIHLTFIEQVEGLVEAGEHGWIGSWAKDHPSSIPPTLAANAVLNTFPDIVKQIASVPFDGIGSFWPSSKTAKGQPLLGGLYDRDDPPFKTFAQFLSQRIGRLLEDLQNGNRMVTEHYPDVFYLSQLELLDLINNDPDMSSPEPMYLDHGDGWQFMFDFNRTRIKSILDWERARTMPLPLVMEAAWLWYWDNPSMSHHAEGAASNHPSPLEQSLLDTFVAGGHHHLVSAFMKRRKYSRAWRSVHLSLREGPAQLLLRREAFLGKEAGDLPGQEVGKVGNLHRHDLYEMFLETTYGEDEGFKRFMARSEVKWEVASRSDCPLTWSEADSEGEDGEENSEADEVTTRWQTALQSQNNARS